MKYYLREKEVTLEELIAKKTELDRINEENYKEWNARPYFTYYPEPGDGWERWELTVKFIGTDSIQFWDSSDECLY